MRAFADQVVVVTGAASGIGLATAEAFAAEGARVWLVDIDPKVAEQARRIGPPAEARTADVTDPDAMLRLAESIAAQAGRVDVLVNNAGICHSRPADQLTLEDWRRHLDVNLWGVIHGIQAFLPGMLLRGQGRIVNVASMAGLLPFPAVAPYCASKFAVVGLSESLAAELAPRGIGVTVVCPGAVRTALLEQTRIAMTSQSGQAVVRLFDLTCTSPERQARDILRAVRTGRTVQLSPGFMLPLYLLQRTSRGLYNRLWQTAVRLVARRRPPSEN